MMKNKQVFTKKNIFSNKKNYNLWKAINFYEQIKWDSLELVSAKRNNRPMKNFVLKRTKSGKKKLFMKKPTEGKIILKEIKCKNYKNYMKYKDFKFRGKKRSKSWQKLRTNSMMVEKDENEFFLEYFENHLNHYYYNEKAFLKFLEKEEKNTKLKDCKLRRRASFEKIKSKKAGRLYQMVALKEYVYNRHHKQIVIFELI